MKSFIVFPVLFAAVMAAADIGLDLGHGYGGHGLAGGIGHGHGGHVVQVSQIRGAPRVSQTLTHGPTHTSVSQGPTHVTRQKVGFTPGTTTIRRDYETDTIHTQHRVDHIRTDKVVPKVTTVQHNAVRPVDVTRASHHTEISEHAQHIPNIHHSSRQLISTSRDSVVHPQVHHVSSHGLGAHY